MGLIYVDEEKLQALLHRAFIESGYGIVDSRKYPYLDEALFVYVKEHDCSYDETW